MAGIRVVHPTARNCRFTITDPGQQYERPRECTPPEFGGCGQVHTHKTHHLNIDDVGSAIVGDVLFEKIRAYLFAFGFSVANVVDKPPTMGIGLGPQVEGRGPWGNIPIVTPGGGNG